MTHWHKFNKIFINKTHSYLHEHFTKCLSFFLWQIHVLKTYKARQIRSMEPWYKIRYFNYNTLPLLDTQHMGVCTKTKQFYHSHKQKQQFSMHSWHFIINIQITIEQTSIWLRLQALQFLFVETRIIIPY